MDPALRAAIIERVELGHTDEQIHAELREAGYDDATIERVVREVRQEHSAAQFAAGSGDAPVAAASLIGNRALLKAGWKLFTKEWRTILLAMAINIGLFVLFIASGLLLFLPIVTTLVAGDDPMQVANGLSTGTLIAVLAWFVIGIIAYSIVSRLVMFAVQRTLVQKTRVAESYKESLRWSFRHVIGIFVIAILVGLVSNFGYTLLFFPGLALAVYLFTTTYIFATGSQKGFAALIASTELVYGRWWPVFGRLLIAGVIIALGLLVVLVVLGLLLALPLYLAGAVVLSVLVGILVLVVVSWLGAGVMQCVGVTLFNSLEASQTHTFTPERKKQLKIFFIIAAILGAIFSVVFNDTDDGTMPRDNSFDAFVSDFNNFEAVLTGTNLYTVAERTAGEQGGSYAEVCNELRAEVEPDRWVDCVDRENAWAATFYGESGAQYCVDRESSAAVAEGGVQAADASCLNAATEGVSPKDRAAELREEMSAPTSTEAGE